MRALLFLLVSLFAFVHVSAKEPDRPYVMVLGIMQDGGYPHAGCAKQCCARVLHNPNLKEYVVSLALVDPAEKKWWLLEAGPDITTQLNYFKKETAGRYGYLPAGIFVSHAHIGHYTGLMQLGREVMGAKNIPVYVLPKMGKFLTDNGPWSQLVNLHNIALVMLRPDEAITLSDNIGLAAFTVPHRDEYSETAGFKIVTSAKSYLFIPDINKWHLWNKDIVEEVRRVDIALLDATFYDTTELPGRSIKEVPHPTVTETMGLFAETLPETKAKIYFIHLNHTNPLIWNDRMKARFSETGFNLALQGAQL